MQQRPRPPLLSTSTSTSANANTIKEYIESMPITTFQRIGYWDKPDKGSFEHKLDEHLLTSPRSVEFIRKKFAKTNYNFDMYFFKRIKMFDPTNVKDVSFKNLQVFYPDVAKAIEANGGPNPLATTAIFTGNDSMEDAMPMTAWIIAHRFGHMLELSNIVDYTFREVKSLVELLTSESTRKTIAKKYDLMSSTVVNTLVNYLTNLVGTFRSARLHKLEFVSEFVYECFAQYLLTGNIKFNTPNADVNAVIYRNNDPITFNFNDPEKREVATKTINNIRLRMLETFARKLHYSVGKIFIF